MHIAQGKIRYQDGGVEEGTFEFGFLIQGKGTFSDGVVKEGTFEFGNLIQEKLDTQTATFMKERLNMAC